MNYGKKGSKKRQAELTSKGIMYGKKMRVIFCKVLLVCCFAVAIIGGSLGFGVYKGILDSAPSIDDIDATPTGYLTTVLDNQGNEIATLVASGSNRKNVTIDEIPINLQHAFVALEDSRFYEHNGIDLTGIIRAGVTGIASGGNFSQGASTITQQLLKNTVFTEWTSETSFIDKLERKIQEQYLAVQLEKKVSKNWIMENYLNAINLGQNTLGVAVASERYFGKDVSELTLSECAVLAAITQNPSRFNPISNPEKNAERRMKVLNNMLDQGFISQSEYDEAVADNVYDRIQLVNVELQDNGINSYFIDELTDQVIRDLVEQKGYTETQAYKTLYQSGLTIYSTQDMDIQNIADEEVNNQDNYTSSPKVSFSYRVSIRSTDGSVKNYSEQTMLSYYKNKDNPNFKSTNYSINFASEEDADAAIEQYKADIMQEGDEIVDGSETVIYTLQPQASLTVIDQSTGEVKAIVGGRGDKTASKTLNRATDTTRQPGSTFKILAAYSAALDAGGLTLASVQDDAPYTYAGANGKSVNNYDRRYRGFTTLREAITDSINIVTVKTLAQAGVSLGWQYVQEYGFTTVDSRDMNEALAYVREMGAPIVVKADGLALGKGVVVAQTVVEAEAAICSMMGDKKFGEAGARVVIEECMTGPEVSVLCFTDGKHLSPMLSSQDHKRAYNNDEGPNTGGMGAFAPSPKYTPEIAQVCMDTIFRPTVEAMAAEGRPFQGCLYFGLMLTPDGPKVVEYNSRKPSPC